LLKSHIFNYFSFSRPCPICQSYEYFEQNIREHLINGHTSAEVADQLCKSDKSAKQCNICSMYIRTGFGLKIYSGHGCQRRIRTWLKDAKEAAKSAEDAAAAAVGTTAYDSLAAVSAVAAAVVQVAVAANAGSTDPAIVSAATSATAVVSK
jgi:hypothetical protein